MVFDSLRLLRTSTLVEPVGRDMPLVAADEAYLVQRGHPHNVSDEKPA